ncbi:hypothetical protein [Kitasatospora indigofera]|uniref:hypothetical protein n=1 Tax=Kitasatospora indigofera TaxID=67307 RepID=UPI0036CD48A1
MSSTNSIPTAGPDPEPVEPGACATTVTDGLNPADYLRIYNFFDKAHGREPKDAAGAVIAERSDLIEAIEMVEEMFGIEALYTILTGRSPRADTTAAPAAPVPFPGRGEVGRSPAGRFS